MMKIIQVIDLVKECWPQYQIDGYRNIWIVKPGALSRGRGFSLKQIKKKFLFLKFFIFQKELLCSIN